MRWNRTASIVTAGLLGLASQATAQTPLTPAFNYQGQLLQNGVPAQGVHNIVFRLYSVAQGGTALGNPITAPPNPIHDGLLAATLNANGEFGSNAFDGSRRWLEITVDGTTLAPRQEITAAPYALRVPGIDGYSLDAFDGSPTDVVFVDAAGNVGIDTTQPQGKFDVRAGGGYFRFDNTFGDLHFNGGSDGVMGIFNEGVATGRTTFISGGVERLVISNSGNIGIGLNNPAAKLDVNGSIAAGQSLGDCILGRGNGAGAIGVHGIGNRIGATGEFGIGVKGESVGNTGVLGDSIDGVGVVGTSQAGNGIFAASSGASHAGLVALSHNPNGWGLWCENDAGGLALNCIGRASVSVLEIRGADISEKFPISDQCKLNPGQVVAIDEHNPGKLCLADGAYNTRVAGIVSGAGDIPVGAILGNLPGKEAAPPIALSGRVWCYCDATSSAITPGDLLTTSETPGYAMKALDRERSHGAVLGKAMTSLTQGEEGLVLVLVNLQ